MSDAPVYLNNAGTSWPKAPGVVDAIADALRSDPRDYPQQFADAREEIAAHFGIASPEQLVLTPGCTSALAAAIAALPWEPGDVLVTSALEHEAMLAPVRRLQRLRGVVHVAVGGTPFSLDELHAAATHGRVRLVAFTGASNVTGERLDIETIAAAGHELGAIVLLDAAQIAGLVPIDARRVGVDMLAFAGHKGPLGPQGIGGLWMRDGIEFDGPAPGYCDLGSSFLAGAAGLATALRWVAGSDRAQPIALRNQLREALARRPGCTVFGGDGPSTGTLSIRLESLPLADAEAFFAARGIVVRSGRHCAPWALRTLGVPDGTIRVSFGVRNEASDLAAVLAALDEV